MAEFGEFLLALLAPALAVLAVAVLGPERAGEAGLLLVALELAHGGEQRPDAAVLQAQMAEAACDIGFELDPALDDTVGLAGSFAVRDPPVRRLRIRETRLEHVANLILSLHRLDVPGEGNEVAPVAVGLKQRDGAFDVA